MQSTIGSAGESSARRVAAGRCRGQLVEVLDHDGATTLIDIVSPFARHELATKADLAVLRADMGALRGDMAELRGTYAPRWLSSGVRCGLTWRG